MTTRTTSSVMATTTKAPEPEAEVAPEVTPISFEEDESDDDVSDGVDELFG